MPKNEVQRLYEDRRGRLWILTLGGLCRREGSTIYSLEETALLGSSRITSILEDSSGAIWLSNPRRIFRWLPGQEGPEAMPDSFAPISVAPELFFASRRGWVALRQPGQLALVEGTEVRARIRPPGKMSDEPPAAAAWMAPGKWAYVIQNQLFITDSTGGQLRIPLPDFWLGREISQLLPDADGGLWVANKYDGAIYLSPEAGGFAPGLRVLQGLGVNRVLQDREGNVWFATRERGLLRLSRTAFGLMHSNSRFGRELPGFEGLQRQVAHMLTGDRQGGFWALGQGRQIFHFDQRQIQQLPPSPGRAHQPLSQILGLQNGALIALDDAAIAVWHRGRWTRIEWPQPLSSVSETPDGSLLVSASSPLGLIRCSFDELLRLAQPGQWEAAQSRWPGEGKMFSAIPARMAVESSSGEYWIARPSGITRLRDGVQQPFRDRHPAFRATARAMSADAEGRVWIGTQGSGIIVLQNDSFHLIGPAQGIECEVINDIYCDAEAGKVWVSTQNGLYRIGGYAFGKDRFSLLRLDRFDGLPSNEVHTVRRSGSLLYVATAQGMALMDTSLLRPRGLAPRLYITAVHDNDASLTLQSQYELSAGPHSLRFEFTALHFATLGRNTFQYRLEPVEREWQFTQNTYANYAALPPGEYVFHLRAFSPQGLESREHYRIPIRIQAPAYQTPAFRALMALLAAIFGILLLSYLFSRRERQHLAQKVAEQTSELNQKVEELKRSNDDLQRFAYVASHDLKSPLRTIISSLQLYMRRHLEQTPSEGREFLHFSLESARTMNLIITDLLAYSQLDAAPPREDLVLGEVLAEVLRSHHSSIEQRKARIEAELLPRIFGVRSQWIQLFSNLIGNGIKFNTEAVPLIWITASDQGEHWNICVMDNGIGIEPAFRERVFEPFRRLRPEDFSGSGIGLAICKRVIELHQGHIWIEESPLGGTSVCFTVPKAL
jgi:signal transduction histidine kinase/ligand-binding sensor domain-containing protein